MGAKDEIAVTVLLAETAAGAVQKVVKQLRAAGLHVGSVEGAIGTVSGSIAPDRLAELRDVPGVEAVERAESYQLPPDDAPQ